MKLSPYNAQTYAKAWFAKMSLEAMTSKSEFFVENQVEALYVQLVQLSNAAASIGGNISPEAAAKLGDAFVSSLSLLAAELTRTDAVLKTDELEKE
jgi:hypothetical protein